MSKQEAPMIYIGTQVEAIEKAKETILEIMCAPYSDTKVKLKALEVLQTLCKVDNVSFSNMTLTKN